MLALYPAASIEEYFGDLVDVDGNPVDLKEMLDTEALNVFEFFPIIASGYEESFGEVTAKLVRPTPYEAGEKLAAVLGVVTYKEDGTQEVAWTVFEAVGVESDSVEEEGCIEVKLDPESVLTIRDNDTLMAIVSK